MDTTVKSKCLCGSDKLALLFNINKGDKSILKCKVCGMAQTYPRPLLDYRCYDFSDSLKYKKVYQSRAKQVIDIVRLFKKSGDLLELGCGPGLLLEVAKLKGFNIKGVEMSTPAVNMANSILGQGIVEAVTAENFNSQGKLFDLIVMNNFLEHTQDPFDILINAYSALKKDGLVVICSPNIDGLYVKIIKGYSYILRPDEHIWQLSISSVKGLLKKAGYIPLKVKKIGFINKELFLHNLSFFKVNRTSIKNLLLNSLNWLCGSLDFGDVFIAVAKKGKI